LITISDFCQHLTGTLPPSELEDISKHEVIGIPLPTKEMKRLGMNKTLMEDQDHLEIYGSIP
jgi:hypothetical protein